jgi:predicted ABC-type ATPase
MASEICGVYINADDIKAQSGCSDMEAAIEAEKLREYYLAHRKDFTFETVLSTFRNIDLIRRAHDAGYEVTCVFVLTASPDLNYFRVRSRALSGGHNVEKETVYKRYDKSLRNIAEVIPSCTEFRIIDNTILPSTIYVRRADGQEFAFENEYWTRADIEALLASQLKE